MNPLGLFLLNGPGMANAPMNRPYPLQPAFAGYAPVQQPAVLPFNAFSNPLVGGMQQPGFNNPLSMLLGGGTGGFGGIISFLLPLVMPLLQQLFAGNNTNNNTTGNVLPPRRYRQAEPEQIDDNDDRPRPVYRRRQEPIQESDYTRGVNPTRPSRVTGNTISPDGHDCGDNRAESPPNQNTCNPAPSTQPRDAGVTGPIEHTPMPDTEAERARMIVRLSMEACHGNRVQAQLMAAQCVLESGCLHRIGNGRVGNSGLARDYNNYFGMKRSGNAGTVNLRTREYNRRTGEHETRYCNFAVYRTAQDSFNAHARLITGNPRYRHVLEATNIHDAAVAVGAAGYCSTPTYPGQVEAVYRTRLARYFDELYPENGSSSSSRN